MSKQQQTEAPPEPTPEQLLSCQIGPQDIIDQMRQRFPVEFELCQLRAAQAAYDKHAKHVVAGLLTRIAQLSAVDTASEIVQNGTAGAP